MQLYLVTQPNVQQQLFEAKSGTIDGEASIYWQRNPVDEACGIAAQPQDCRGDLIRIAETPHRMFAQNLLRQVLLYVSDRWHCNRVGAYRIHTNILRREI